MNCFVATMLGCLVSVAAFSLGMWLSVLKKELEAKRKAAEPQVGEVWRMERAGLRCGNPWGQSYLYVLIGDKKDGWVRYFFNRGDSLTDFLTGEGYGAAAEIKKFMSIFERMPL